jgi:hypothetical protein
MKKILLGIIITLVIIVVIPLALLGIIPGLSTVFGAGQVDFGIKITKEDSKAAIDKVGVEIIALPKGTEAKDDFKLEGKKDVDFTLDSKELTAHSNYRPWKNFPVKNMQIRINMDGTVEGSGILVVSKAIPYATALGYSEEQVKEAMEKYKIPSLEVPFYVKGNGGVTNNKVTVNASTVKVGAVTVPANIVSQANKEAESVLEDIIQRHKENLNYENLSFSDGKMHLKGQVSEKEYVTTE